jgi:transcriptional regulator with XRE-family HTH domain
MGQIRGPKMITKVKELQKPGLTGSPEGKQSFTNLISRKALTKRLMRGRETRARFVESHLNKGLAFQIQSLRDRKDWSQQELADKLGTNQNAVYRLENPGYGKPTLTTLKKVAAVFDVALVVRFVPFSQVVNWVSGTPFIDRGLTPSALEVPSFEDELEAGAFNELNQSS